MPDRDFRYRMYRKWLDDFLVDRERAMSTLQSYINDETFNVALYFKNIFIAYGRKKLLGITEK